jgi:hypothetical protein
MDRTRASDSERERVVALLEEAAVAGRLTVEELEARSERAYTAVTRAELAVLLEDLPVGAWMTAPQPQYPRRDPPAAATSQPKWPGPRPWMPGDLHFHVRWRGPSNPRHAGAQVMQHIVPMFTEAGYELVERTPDKLVLRRGAPRAEVTIAMTDRGDHSVTEVYGVAPQPIREALARLSV